MATVRAVDKDGGFVGLKIDHLPTDFYSVCALMEGKTICTIYGIPSTAGEYTLTATAVDNFGGIDVANFELIIR